MKSKIIIKTQFEGMHRWKDAPDEVFFLKDPHRHIFYVEVEMSVNHDDRELEFILVKRSINEFLAEAMGEIDSSCETMAKQICEFLEKKYGKRSIRVAVLEDNENGGIVENGF